jgi:hypothetical protein
VPHIDLPLVCPVRSVLGGWRDPWDEPHELPALQERIAAFDAQTAAITAAWQSERRREARLQRRRHGSGRAIDRSRSR